MSGKTLNVQSAESVSRQDRTDMTRECLKEVAFELLADGGVAALTVSALARSSGFSKAIVNYHFGSKANFIQYLLDESFIRHGSIYQIPDSLDDEVMMLRTMLVRIYEYATEHPKHAFAYLALVYSCNNFDEETRQIIRQHNRRVRSMYENVIRSGQEKGSIRSDVDAEGLAMAISGAVKGVVMEVMVDEDVEFTAAFNAMDRVLAQWLAC